MTATWTATVVGTGARVMGGLHLSRGENNSGLKREWREIKGGKQRIAMAMQMGTGTAGCNVTFFPPIIFSSCPPGDAWGKRRREERRGT